MEPIIVAIALICGPEVCGNEAFDRRFQTVKECEQFLSEERIWQEYKGNMVVLDDCITTTEQRIAEFR